MPKPKLLNKCPGTFQKVKYLIHYRDYFFKSPILVSGACFRKESPNGPHLTTLWSTSQSGFKTSFFQLFPLPGAKQLQQWRLGTALQIFTAGGPEQLLIPESYITVIVQVTYFSLVHSQRIQNYTVISRMINILKPFPFLITIYFF